MYHSVHRSFLPNLCGIRPLFAVVMVGQLLAFVLTVAGTGFGPGALTELALISLYVQWVGLSAAAVLCLARGWLARQTEATAVSLAYALVMLTTLLVCEAAWWVLTSPDVGQPSSLPQHAAFVARTLVVAAIVTAVALRYFYVQHQWRERTAAAASARLQALQARIRPHFLFNCMNTIASLIRSDPESAERAVEDLSDLLRVSLSEARQVSTLEEEFELVQRYLDIESLRLGSRLQVVWPPVVPRGILLPPLCLQPLVENAIGHGIEPRHDGGVIRIDVLDHGTAVHITVSNPLAPGPHAVRGHRLAQENLRQRLAAQFGEAAGLDLEVVGQEYRATLILPRPRSGV